MRAPHHHRWQRAKGHCYTPLGVLLDFNEPLCLSLWTLLSVPARRLPRFPDPERHQSHMLWVSRVWAKNTFDFLLLCKIVSNYQIFVLKKNFLRKCVLWLLFFLILHYVTFCTWRSQNGTIISQPTSLQKLFVPVCVVTQAEGADADAAAAEARQAAHSQEEQRIRQSGRGGATHSLHAQANEQHRALAIPAPKKDKTNKNRAGDRGDTESREGCCCRRFSLCFSAIFPRLWYRSEMAPPNSDPSSIPTMKRVWLYGSHPVHAHTDWHTQTQAVRHHNTTHTCTLCNIQDICQLCSLK